MNLTSTLLLAAALLCAGGCDKPGEQAEAAAGSSTLPALTGRVVDNAGIISPAAEQRLSQRLAELESRTTDQLVVVTLDGLGGETIEQMGLKLGNGWGIGREDKDNGVLLLVVPNERKVRLEVGIGLESVLTNARSRDIIDKHILPRFKQGAMEPGIIAGVDAVITTLERRAS